MKTRTNHQIIWRVVESKFDTVICWLMEKTFIRQKSHWVNFRSLLPRITNQNQEITSTRNLTPNLVYPKVPTYSRILNQFPIDLDFVETSSFYMDPSTWLIASNLKLVVGCKDLQYTCIEGNTWLQNSKAHKNTVASK